MRHAVSLGRVGTVARRGNGTIRAFHTAKAGAELPPDILRSWEQRLATLRRERGIDGAWAVFQTIHKDGLTRLFTLPDAGFLRDGVLVAALDDDTRTAEIIRVAHQLFIDYGFRWPELYVNIMQLVLGQNRFVEAVRCHWQLAPFFPPKTEAYGALISNFVVDASQQMQDTLKTLYFLSTHRGLYDHVIPALFSAGQSHLARAWRKTFIHSRDYPTTAKSSPFLAFLVRYYRLTVLTEEELFALRLGHRHLRLDGKDGLTRPTSLRAAPTGQYSDSIVAKWFASLWTSVDFAINLVHKLGLRVVGPKSLQSLALRESDAKGFATRIEQLEKLGINIAPQTYCKAIVSFAKRGEDDLLMELANCDIHPDEFDNEETLEALLAASARESNWQRTKLLQSVEKACTNGTSSQQLNTQLARGLRQRRAGEIRSILDRIEALGYSVIQDNASKLLKCAYDGISAHPTEWLRSRKASDSDPDTVLNNAIEFTRRLSRHDVAIPLRYWRLLLHNLGRLGRLDELEQICLEVVQLYRPPCGGLIPVHREDWPRLPPPKTRQGESETKSRVGARDAMGTGTKDEMKGRHVHETDTSLVGSTERQYSRLSHGNKSTVEGLAGGTRLADQERDSSPDLGSWQETTGHENSTKSTTVNQSEKEYIPADLPFSVRQHPIQKLFDTHLQRSVVRWGFDQTLAARPRAPALMEIGYSAGARAFDVACGVRLLAIMRDQGVYIDKQIVISSLTARIVLAQAPGRPRDRSRDKHELEPEHLMLLVEKAWGSPLFRSLPEMLRMLEERKPAIWKRYPELFPEASDKGSQRRAGKGHWKKRDRSGAESRA